MDEDGFADKDREQPVCTRWWPIWRQGGGRAGAAHLRQDSKQDIAELDGDEKQPCSLTSWASRQVRPGPAHSRASYDLLGLISFLTYGKDECRAWTIRKGTKAPQAAGKIHCDIERGFIRAETSSTSTT